MTILMMLIITFNVLVICITYNSAKNKAIKLQRDLAEQERADKREAEFRILEADYPKSPYGVKRQTSNGTWGYCITHNGQVMFDENKAQLFTSIHAAVYEINKLERIEGYKQTRV
ncbi:hypothetical protein DQT32_03985 [Salmonella enterica subsp. enterica serovar Braenderup]|nr:hypothetical protein [Salmonella enterica subsp. enterica serovar Braenderup]